MERGEEGVELPMPDGGVTAEVAGPGLAGVLSDINPSLSFWTGLSDRQICNL
jgi:hypothetical protein